MDGGDLAVVLGPIGGIILLVALCYCCYRCCCCCCRDNKQVVVVNTTNMVQPACNPQPMVLVNSVSSSGYTQAPPIYSPRTEFDNPVYNLPSVAVPLLPEETPETDIQSDIQLNKF